jgi:hypothetical protein
MSKETQSVGTKKRGATSAIRVAIGAGLGALLLSGLSEVLRIVVPAQAATAPVQTSPSLMQSGPNACSNTGQSGGIACPTFNGPVNINPTPKQPNKIIDPRNGTLSPAKYDKRCRADAFSIIGGKNYFSVTKWPYTMVYLDGRPILTFRKDHSKILLDRLHLFDDRHNVIVHVEDNTFSILGDYTRIASGSGRTTLVIFDHNDVQALKLTYASQCVMRIEGIFRNEKSGVTIGDEYMELSNGVRFSGTYWQNASIIMDAHSATVGRSPAE